MPDRRENQDLVKHQILVAPIRPIAMAIHTIAVKLDAALKAEQCPCHSLFSGQSVSIEGKTMTLFFRWDRVIIPYPFFLGNCTPSSPPYAHFAIELPPQHIATS